LLWSEDKHPCKAFLSNNSQQRYLCSSSFCLSSGSYSTVTWEVQRLWWQPLFF